MKLPMADMCRKQGVERKRGQLHESLQRRPREEGTGKMLAI